MRASNNYHDTLADIQLQRHMPKMANPSQSDKLRIEQVEREREKVTYSFDPATGMPVGVQQSEGGLTSLTATGGTERGSATGINTTTTDQTYNAYGVAVDLDGNS